MMKRYYVYILQCADKSYYTGMTSDIEKRLVQHKEGKTFDGYTHSRRPIELQWYVECNDVNNAISLEKQIKGWSRLKKKALIRDDFDNLVEFSKNYTENGTIKERIKNQNTKVSKSQQHFDKLSVTSQPNINIIPLQEKHYVAVSQIYKEGLATGLATFETEVPSWKKWNEKFMKSCRFVAVIDDTVVGWGALSKVSDRCVYEGVAENTVYISQSHQGKGIGKSLLYHLITESETAGFWTLQAGIFSENIPSIKLHEACGFRVLGIREKIAQRDGKWHDNVLMERRSSLF